MADLLQFQFSEIGMCDLEFNIYIARRGGAIKVVTKTTYTKLDYLSGRNYFPFVLLES